MATKDRETQKQQRSTNSGKSSEQYEKEIKILKEEIKDLRNAKWKLLAKIQVVTVEKEKLEREKEEERKIKKKLEEQLVKCQRQLHKIRVETEEKHKRYIEDVKAAHQEERRKLMEEKERGKELLKAAEVQKTKIEDALRLARERIKSLATEKARYQERYEMELIASKEKERQAKKQQIERLREAELERIKRLEHEAKQSALRLLSLSTEAEEQNSDEDDTPEKLTADEGEDEHTKLLKEQIRNLKTKAEEAVEKDRSLSHFKKLVQQMKKEKEMAEPQKLTESERLKMGLAKLTTKKAVGRVKMARISTRDMNLYDLSDLTVMEGTGMVVVHGKTDRDDPPSTFILSREEGDGWAVKAIESPCKHRIVCLLGVEVEGQKLLARSCFKCEEIKLLNLDTQQVTTACSGMSVGKMCHGDTNRLYVQSVGDSVLELDGSNYDFAKIKTINTGIDSGYYGLCYIPPPHRYIVVCGKVIIRAISCDDDEIVWTKETEVDGKEIDPRGLLFSPQHNAVLVCDYSNSRILILDPSNGSCLQAINMYNTGFIYDIHFCKEHIIVLHEHQKQGRKMSFFSVK